MGVSADGAAGHVDVVSPRIWTTGEPCHGGPTWLAGTCLHNLHRRNRWIRPLVLADRPLFHGPRCTLRSAASAVRVDVQRAVSWGARDPKIDRRRAARDLRRRHDPNKTERSIGLSASEWANANASVDRRYHLVKGRARRGRPIGHSS